VLAQMPAAERWDRDAFIDGIIDPKRSATQQLAPAEAFGQPGVTAFFGDELVIEVYYWLSSTSAIHNHPFCGLFTVLEGFSVHARYEVGELVPAGGRALVGDVALAKLELLEAGDHALFSLERHPLVHALIHVPVPSISMVIRTVRTEGYMRYLPPCVALPMDVPRDPLARQLALLQSLRRAGDPAFFRTLRAMLRRADLERAIRILSPMWTGSYEAEMQELMGELEVCEHRDELVLSLDRALRMNEADALRRQVGDPEARLVATALMYADRRDHVRSLASDEALARFIELPVVFSEEERASKLIAEALIEGQGEAGALQRLRAEYGEEAVEEQRQSIRDYCRRSIFSPLAVTA
jgi:hypothetical protein